MDGNRLRWTKYCMEEISNYQGWVKRYSRTPYRDIHYSKCISQNRTRFNPFSTQATIEEGEEVSKYY